MSSLERFKCKARREQYSPKRAGDKKMKRNITQYDFLRAFQEWTANDRHLSFSREALLEIYDILTEYEDNDNYNEMTDDEKFDALNYDYRAWEVFNTGRILIQE
jgi:hypothetical protein